MEVDTSNIKDIHAMLVDVNDKVVAELKELGIEPPSDLVAEPSLPSRMGAISNDELGSLSDDFTRYFNFITDELVFATARAKAHTAALVAVRARVTLDNKDKPVNIRSEHVETDANVLICVANKMRMDAYRDALEARLAKTSKSMDRINKELTSRRDAHFAGIRKETHQNVQGRERSFAFGKR